MKKLMYLVMAIAMSLFAADASAQYIPVTASSCIVDGSGSTITSGTLIVVGTDSNDNPVVYRAGTTFITTTAPITKTITAGSVPSFQLADPSSSSPLNVSYRFVVQDNTTKKITVYKGINITPNDVLSGGSFTTFNICKMNPGAGVASFGGFTTPSLVSGDWTVTRDLIVGRNASLPNTGTLSVNNIKQQAGAGFVLADPLGISHFFISSSSPYVNTFVNGNGSGGVFLGSAAKTSVADTTGNIVTAGSIALQNTSQLLPATIANDTLGGLLFTTNAGKGWQVANSNGQLQGFAGVTILLQGATSGGITLTVPATAGSNTLNFPAATDTLVGQNTTDTLTNKTITTLALTGGTTNRNLKFNGSAQVVNGNTTDDGTTFSTNTLKLQTQVGVSQGSGHKHQRFGTLCTTAATAGANCTTAVTWTSAFADSSYTVSCTGVTATNAPVLTVESIAAAGFTVRIFAIVGSAATFSLADCIADHD